MTFKERGVNTDSESKYQHKDLTPEVIIKATWSFGWAVITAVCSLFISFPVVKIFIFGGRQTSIWGFEYVFCFLSPVPGVIAYVIFYNLLNKQVSSFAHSVKSTVIGVIVACISIVILYLSLIAREDMMYADQKKINQQNISELNYLKDALYGMCDDHVVREHYSKSYFPIIDHLDKKKILDRRSHTISPKALALLIDISKNSPAVQGFLADQPETSLDLKLKVADSQLVEAVLPMASNANTPVDVLSKLVSYPELCVRLEVINNPSTPLTTLRRSILNKSDTPEVLKIKEVIKNRFSK